MGIETTPIAQTNHGFNVMTENFWDQEDWSDEERQLANLLVPEPGYGDPDVNPGDKVTSPMSLGPKVQTVKKVFIDRLPIFDNLPVACAHTEEGFTLVAIEKADDEH